MTYFNYRYYNSKHGKWISRDLVSDIEAKNRYMYVRIPFEYDILGLKSNESTTQQKTVGIVPSLTFEGQTASGRKLDINIDVSGKASGKITTTQVGKYSALVSGKLNHSSTYSVTLDLDGPTCDAIAPLTLKASPDASLNVNLPGGVQGTAKIPVAAKLGGDQGYYFEANAELLNAKKVELPQNMSVQAGWKCTERYILGFKVTVGITVSFTIPISPSDWQLDDIDPKVSFETTVKHPDSNWETEISLENSSSGHGTVKIGWEYKF